MPSIFMLASFNATIIPTVVSLILANFAAITAVENSYGQTTLSAYVKATDTFIGDGTRQTFRVVFSLTPEDALNIVHDTFVDIVRAQIRGVAGLQVSVAFKPVTNTFKTSGIANVQTWEEMLCISIPLFVEYKKQIPSTQIR
jgi:hypothetical protein